VTGTHGKLLFTVRYLLPGLLIVAGLVVMSLGGDAAAEGGMGFIGAGLAVLLLNALFRMGVKGDEERTREADARAYFAEHGHWPDETPEEIATRRARRGGRA
jgi:hypothetical protein